jgi:hypothetical protein
VPKKGLEPPHPCEYVDLNHARLPIPPLRHATLPAKSAERARISSLSESPPCVKLRNIVSVGCEGALYGIQQSTDRDRL